MDPIWNCVLAVCCPPFAESRMKAIAELLQREGCDTFAAEICAPYIAKTFDLMPLGSLQQMKDIIAACARGADYKG